MVVDNVSLSLSRGETYVLMGPNGAGKTSIVRLLTGLMAPQAGTVSIGDGMGRARNGIALVPQDIALYPWLTARENCLAFARFTGLGKQEAARQSDQALDLCTCREVADIRLSRLSGGFQRRVNIAAAIVGQPRLLVLDEPTVGIDRDAKRAIATTLRALAPLGTAVFLVTHDFDDAQAVADRVGFLKAGSLVAQGAPDALVEDLCGRRKRVEILLAHGPDAGQAALLSRLGATQGENPERFILFSEIADWNATRILAGIEATGVRVKEMRVANPGLETLYAHYCGVAAP